MSVAETVRWVFQPVRRVSARASSSAFGISGDFGGFRRLRSQLAREACDRRKRGVLEAAREAPRERARVPPARPACRAARRIGASRLRRPSRRRSARDAFVRALELWRDGRRRALDVVRRVDLEKSGAPAERAPRGDVRVDDPRRHHVGQTVPAAVDARERVRVPAALGRARCCRLHFQPDAPRQPHRQRDGRGGLRRARGARQPADADPARRDERLRPQQALRRHEPARHVAQAPQRPRGGDCAARRVAVLRRPARRVPREVLVLLPALRRRRGAGRRGVWQLRVDHEASQDGARSVAARRVRPRGA